MIHNKPTHYPIHTAILNNQLNSVIQLLHVNNTALQKDSNGWLPLHYAARYANKEIIEACCQFSTNKDTPDAMGRTPIMIAAESGRLSAVITLIGYQAQVDLSDSAGLGILHYAVKSGNLDLVRWLIEHTHLDINATDGQNQTPVQLSETNLSGTDKNKISSFLLEHGAKLTLLPPYG